MEEENKKVEELKTNEKVEELETEEKKVEELEPEEKVEELEPEEKTPKNKNTGLKVFFVFLGLLIVTAIVLIVLLLTGTFNKQTSNKKEKTSTEAKKTNTNYKMTGNDIQDFDIGFLKIENQEKNMIYSPLSIKYTLAMLNEGADGDSKEQITNVIGDYKSKKYMNSEHISLANALFVRDSFKKNIKDDYIKNIKTKYDVEVIEDSFKKADKINNWTSEKTFKLIDNVVSDDDIQDLNFALVNALAIDMNWNNALQCASGIKIPCISYGVSYEHENYYDGIGTISSDLNGKVYYPDMTFNGKDKTKSVQIGASFNNYDIVKDLGEDKIRETVGKEYDKFLSEGGCGDDPDRETYLNKYIEEINSNYKKEDYSTDFYFYDNSEVKVFAKDLKEYDGSTLQYVGIMPKEKKLTDYINDLNAKEAQKLIGNLKELKAENFEEGVVTKVKANIPLFNYEYKLNLQKDLETMGIKDIFDINKANLSKMLSGERQFIEKTVHKANIEFSNEGIKASAVTFMGGAGAAGCNFDHRYDVPIKEIDLTFDKPYMYIIRDKASGEVWFAGTVYEPESN